MFLFFLSFYLIKLSFEQFSAFPTWIGNPYIQTGSYDIITDFQTVSQSGGANITFDQAYMIPPKVAFAITSYSGNDGLFDQDFYMDTLRVTPTQAELFIFMQGATNLRILYVLYLAVHPDFMYHLNTFNDVQANYSSGTLSLDPINQYTGLTRIFVNYINYTELCSTITTDFRYFGSNLSKNKIAVYLSGIFNYVSNSPLDLPEIRFDITTEAVNASFFKLQVEVYPTYEIDLLRLSFITMDIQNIETSKQYTIIYSTARYYTDQDNYIPLQKQFFSSVFIGMLDFNTQSPMCTIDFSLVFQPNNQRIIVKKSTPHSLSLFPDCGLKSARLVTFFMKTWLCPDPYYYFNLNTDMCDDYCASYLYGNITAKLCKPCPTGCVKCSPADPDICTNCDSLVDFRQLVNGSCQCMKGYYQTSSTSVSCSDCTSVAAHCADCALGAQFQCNQCIQGWFLQNDGSCSKCTMVGCISCTSISQCILCDSSLGYTLVSNKTCQICPISCTCDGYYLPILTDFNTGINHCTTVCGDGLKRQFQQCDDGNSYDYDGCSSACKIQQFWTCDALQPSCCSIDESTLFLKVQDVQKTKGQNSFQIHLALYPHLKILSAQTLNNSLHASIIGIKIQKQQILVQEVQKIILKYFYTQHAQKRQCNITLKFQLNQSSNPSCFMTIQTSMVLYPDSSNNLPLMFFSKQNYQKEQALEEVTDVILYGSYGVLLLSALPCKIIGLQLFGVLQLAYFSLAQIQDLNLMLIPLLKLGSSNGFNPELFSNNQKLPNKIDYLSYDALFLNNCGVMLGILLIEVTVGLVLYGMATLFQSAFNILSLAKRFLKQGLLTLLVFNSLNFAFGVGIHFQYSRSQNEDYLINSVFAVGSLILPLIVGFALIFTDSKQFGQFKDKFKKQKNCSLYFVITIIYRYGVGYYIAAKSEQSLASLIILAFSLLFILYNFVNLPFISALHNYRANICHLSQFAILLTANYYQSMKQTTSLQQKSIIFTPAFLDMSVILISLGISFIAVIYEIYLFIKSFSMKITNSSSKFSKLQLSSTKIQTNKNQINFTKQNIKDSVDKDQSDFNALEVENIFNRKKSYQLAKF